MERVDCIVIGAGVVGISIARRLALAGREVVVLEAEDAIGTHTSSRNSEVIHAGIYYPSGSLKARLCMQGLQAIYRYCAEREVAHRRCGKLIVATSEPQRRRLEAIRAQAEANGVADLQVLAGVEAKAMEPELACVAALLSPSTGIIDSHGYMLSLQGDAENRGAVIVLRSPVMSGRVTAKGIELDIGGPAPSRILARSLVNSGGLHAQRVAASIAGVPAARIPPCHYAKGNYYTLAGRSPFSRLIYPVPEPAGLGVHLTLDLAGQTRFGPDVEWVESIDYRVDPDRAEDFYRAIRTYWPDIKEGSLQPAYSGIRPKIQAIGGAARDFVIEGPRHHGVDGLVNLFGIESPGLTASLAIADYVHLVLKDR
ncbi:MAG: NAD(P)/FAD-dependent oxidoreductase [Betaproteobacteria bacterium]|nr:NAD(P)/FAD-dependent oxidoreductase [Betaproteobacteria bacterium]